MTLVAPDRIVTGEGTVTEPLLLDTATLVLLVAAPERVTVHVDVPGGVKVPGVQVRLESTGGGGALSVSVKVLEVAPSVAVSRAEPLALTAAGALAVKLALVAPDRMGTGEGTVTEPLLLDTATLVLLVAAPDRVTVHVDVPGGVRVPGVHDRLDSTDTTGWLMVMVVPVPVRPRLLPPPSVEDKPESIICDELLVVVGDM